MREADNKKITLRTSGFTLIELMVVISIIGFLLVAAIFSFSAVRIHSRDALRAGNAATFSRALALYMNDQGSYPLSAGECLNSNSGAGKDMKDSNVIVDIPVDPRWPAAVPTNINEDGYAQGASTEFCYYYAGTETNYYISYYLESDSKSGVAGIHVVTPAGPN
jgi:prepilin-type N-terminal cleavage/methylation domain-containing protein